MHMVGLIYNSKLDCEVDYEAQQTKCEETNFELSNWNKLGIGHEITINGQKKVNDFESNIWKTKVWQDK